MRNTRAPKPDRVHSRHRKDNNRDPEKYQAKLKRKANRRAMKKIKQYEQGRKMAEEYLPSKGGPLKGRPNPDPQYHELIKKLYRSTSTIWKGHEYDDQD